MGDRTDDIFLSFLLSAEQAKDYSTVRTKSEDHFVVKKNTIFKGAKFNLRGQREGESVDFIVTDLYCLCEHCDFGTLKEDLIRDRIAVGLRDKKLSEKLQLDAQLTLEKAISLVRQSETVKKQQPILHGEQLEEIDRVYDSKGTTKKLFKPKKKGKQSDSKQQTSVGRQISNA